MNLDFALPVVLGGPRNHARNTMSTAAVAVAPPGEPSLANSPSRKRQADQAGANPSTCKSLKTLESTATPSTSSTPVHTSLAKMGFDIPTRALRTRAVLAGVSYTP